MNPNKRFLILVLGSIFFLTLFSSEAFTQWQQTQGPYGGTFQYLSFADADDELFAGTYQGNIFKYSNGEWQFLSNVSNASDLVKFNSSLFVLSDYGFYRSTNDGHDWVLEMEGNASSYFKKNGIFYVCVEDTIYKTEDGENWENALVSTDANTILFGEPTVQQLINIEAFSIIDSIALLGCTTSVYPVPQGIFVSINYGEDWFLPESVEDPTWASAFKKIDNYYYFASNRGVSRSTDNGLTWLPINSGLSENLYISKMSELNNELYVLTNSPRSIYKLEDTNWVDLNLGFEPSGYTLGNGKMYVSETDKIYMSEISSMNLTDITDGLIATTVKPYALSDEVVLAVGYNKIYKTSDGGENWLAKEDQTFSKFLVGDNYLFGIGGGIFFSSDQGESWESKNAGIPSSYIGYENAIAETDNKIYVGYSKSRARTHLPPVWEAGGIYTSTDNGSSWSSSSSGIPTQGSVKAPVYWLYACSDHVIARTIEGYFRSIDDGNSWSVFESGLPEFAYPLKIIPFGDRLYCISNKGIYYSVASESEWKSAGEGLPGDSDPLYYYGLNLVGVKDKLYALKSGPDQLVYYLDDGQWIPVEVELPTEADFIHVSASENFIYAGARDAGVWKGTLDQTTDILISETTPTSFSLEQNYPNPFNPSTKIKYSVPENSFVELKIYDMLGSEVTTLVNEQRSAGTYVAEFNSGSLNSGITSGVYFYKLNINSGNNNFSETKKMIMLK